MGSAQFFASAWFYGALVLCVVVQLVDALRRWRRRSGGDRDVRWPWVRYLLLGAVPALFVGLWTYDTVWGRRHRVAEWLNIPQPPASLWVLDCASSPVMTDVLANCEVSIAPRDFEALLAGYKYERQAVHGSQVNLSAGVRDFEATDVYVAEPKRFVHGGSVMVYVNARRDLAIVDLYIE